VGEEGGGAVEEVAILGGENSEWPGAGAVVVKPVTAGDCPRYQDLDELMRAEYAAGRGATIRGGRCMTIATPAELASTCQLPVPEISAMPGSPFYLWEAFVCAGVNFGAVEGELWRGDQSTWTGSIVKGQFGPIVIWGDTMIQGLIGMSVPWGNVWVYVFRDDGYYNEDGFPISINP